MRRTAFVSVGNIAWVIVSGTDSSTAQCRVPN